MSHCRSLACLALSLAGLAALPGQASACGGATPGLAGRSVFPASGARGVPTNARVLVTYRGGHDPWTPFRPEEEVVLRAVGQPALPVDIETRQFPLSIWEFNQVVIIKARAPLKPATTYEVLDRRPRIPCVLAECAAGDLAAIATFTTGAGPDVEPPRFGGLAALEVGTIDDCRNEGCCGPYRSRSVMLRWTAAEDAVSGSEVLYNVYGPGGGEPLVGLYAGTTIGGNIACGWRGGPLGFMSADGAFSVRAVDWAGNEDSNIVQQVTSNSCPAAVAADAGADASTGAVTGAGAATADAGSPAGPDGPLADAAPAADPARSDHGGCRVGGQGQPGGSWPLLALVLLPLAVRRKR